MGIREFAITQRDHRDHTARHHQPSYDLPSAKRSVQNVERAVREEGLEYPVGLDNDFVAWNAYGNRYWPTMYLIDRAGQIRYTHIGEGQLRPDRNCHRHVARRSRRPRSRDKKSLLTKA